MVHDYHVPVLADEATNYLINETEGVYVDGTLGGGGHADNILTKLSPKGKLIALDLDKDALRYAGKRLEKYGDRCILVHENFSKLKSALKKLSITGINGFLLDLGISSYQIDRPERGFSYRSDARIDMRMNPDQPLDGWNVINKYAEDRLAAVFFKYGEEHRSRVIARQIALQRLKKPIDTTAELSAIVQSSVGMKYLKKSLARIFQALRIEVNNEIENIRTALEDSVDLLLPGSRIVVISYHSLEDRIVKDFFRSKALTTIRSGTKLLPDTPIQPTLRVITKKPVIPGNDEIEQNPRSRSAKLRVAEKT